MPDLNSLPASNPPPEFGSTMATTRLARTSFGQDCDQHTPPSPRSPQLSSLQAAATINAGLRRTPSISSQGREQSYHRRRRSSLMNNISLNDPAVPSPGEMLPNSAIAGATAGNSNSPRLRRTSFRQDTADPHHQRQPSLGELHQELENEQEAQVNRLLSMIRLQQDQLAAAHRQHQGPGPDQDSLPITRPDQTRFPSSSSNLSTSNGQTSPVLSNTGGGPFNRTHSISRRSSMNRPHSRSGSPVIRSASAALGPLSESYLLGGTRDECAFYQAETQTLTRENQMLKLRIRELEKQIAELGATPSSGQQSQASSGMLIHSPRQRSPLTNLQGGSDLQSATAHSSFSNEIAVTD